MLYFSKSIKILIILFMVWGWGCTLSASSGKFYIGPTFGINVTSFWDIQPDESSSQTNNFKPLVTLGGGVNSAVQFSNGWALHLEALYLKTGVGTSNVIINSTSPSYAFEYISFMSGAQYNFSMSNTVSPYFKLGIPLNFLLNAKNQTGIVEKEITNQVRRFDAGVSLAIGAKLKMKDGPQVMLEAFGTLALTKVLAGSLEDNKIQSKNIIAGIRASFLVPIKK